MKQFIFFYLICFSLKVSGQSLEELRKQKARTASEIEYINNLLKETNSSVKFSLNKLKVLERQIKLQDELINSITGEIGYLDHAIRQNQFRIDSLNNEMKIIKAKYASMVRYAQRNQNSNNQLLFLLSAQDFNQAYKRFMYLRQYGDYRRKQAERIVEYKNQIDNQLSELSNRKTEKQSLLNVKVKESDKIAEQKLQQTLTYTELKQKEKTLAQKLEMQRKAEQQLQQEIERVISEEAKKVNRKSAKPDAGATAEDKLLSGDFSNNRGKFPWPVTRGVITDHFGEHPHPVLKHVTVRNSGIDITTQANSKALVIFKGVVTKVVAIPGGNMAVIIRHGNYLSVYSNLKDVFVKAGQKVETKEEVGTIFTDENDDNKTVLKFQIWRENNKLDPEEWITKH